MLSITCWLQVTMTFRYVKRTSCGMIWKMWIRSTKPVASWQMAAVLFFAAAPHYKEVSELRTLGWPSQINGTFGNILKGRILSTGIYIWFLIYNWPPRAAQGQPTGRKLPLGRTLPRSDLEGSSMLTLGRVLTPRKSYQTYFSVTITRFLHCTVSVT